MAKITQEGSVAGGFESACFGRISCTLFEELEASPCRVHVDLARLPFVRFERLLRRMIVGIKTEREELHRSLV